ncbi:MBL fold metallo-hydrolase [Muricauda sp. SCSIO 64092]|uniref:MBL fold metallo-hydrolase n=1 Tax=Allomuricauda sp. SCSIO 64092 TaxID=2908842 RepID=UPI001FF4340E|nr:MBL fold metallo-hydrolase [Muricauda sp. SCSIO 64092]UOY06273.1 MBL fold metallo-hydrolase [Muricauda sp. SCSIO 64092]
MKNLYFLLISLFCLSIVGCGNRKKEPISVEGPNEEFPVSTLDIRPIQHATMVMEWNGITIYVDPVGGKSAFQGQKQADLILITDIHGDHFNLETLQQLNTKKAKIMVPLAVAERIPDEFTPQLDVLDNGDTKERYGICVEAVPMYNVRQEALKYHKKGRGNGYVLEMNGERIYISGDTEDVPEMRALRNIDKAFVCMNLPYTMTVESAADAVLEFKPKEVYPYHYRGTDGFSDVERFKSLVEEGNTDIGVILLNWYKP